MKKLLSLLLAAAMVVALAACGSSAPAPTAAPTEAPAATPVEVVDAEPVEAPVEVSDAAPDYASMSLEELKPLISTVTGGKLTVATSPDFAPYEFYAVVDGTPKLAGFDMALAAYLAEGLGLELEVIPMDFDGTIAELTNGNVDLGMAGYSPKPERAEVMDFSDVYITGGQSFVCLNANADKFPDLAATNNPDFSIGAQVGSIQVDLAHENSPDADIIEVTKVTDIIAQLLAGKLDGAYIETMVAESYAKNYPELNIILEVPYDAPGSVVGINKGNAPLVAAVNLLIAECKSSGTFDQYVFEANELAGGEIIEGLIE